MFLNSELIQVRNADPFSGQSHKACQEHVCAIFRPQYTKERRNVIFPVIYMKIKHVLIPNSHYCNVEK